MNYQLIKKQIIKKECLEVKTYEWMSSINQIYGLMKEISKN